MSTEATRYQFKANPIISLNPDSKNSPEVPRNMSSKEKVTEHRQWSVCAKRNDRPQIRPAELVDCQLTKFNEFQGMRDKIKNSSLKEPI